MLLAVSKCFREAAYRHLYNQLHISAIVETMTDCEALDNPISRENYFTSCRFSMNSYDVICMERLDFFFTPKPNRQWILSRMYK